MLVRTVKPFSEYISIHPGTDREIRIYFNGLNPLGGGGKFGIELIGENAQKEDVYHMTRRRAELNNKSQQ